jgi:hypothetical protein
LIAVARLVAVFTARSAAATLEGGTFSTIRNKVFQELKVQKVVTNHFRVSIKLILFQKQHLEFGHFLNICGQSSTQLVAFQQQES